MGEGANVLREGRKASEREETLNAEGEKGRVRLEVGTVLWEALKMIETGRAQDEDGEET